MKAFTSESPGQDCTPCAGQAAIRGANLGNEQCDAADHCSICLPRVRDGLSGLTIIGAWALISASSIALHAMPRFTPGAVSMISWTGRSDFRAPPRVAQRSPGNDSHALSSRQARTGAGAPPVRAAGKVPAASRHSTSIVMPSAASREAAPPTPLDTTGELTQFSKAGSWGTFDAAHAGPDSRLQRQPDDVRIHDDG